MPKKNGVSEYALEKMNDEREALNVGGEMSRDDSEHNSVTSSVTSHHRKKKLDDDEDEEPTKDLLVYYARNSTMHGIPSIVGSKLYRGRHIFWIIIVCMMALFLGTVIYWQMSDYYNYPTVTSVDISYVKKNDFPAITICDPNVLQQPILNIKKLDIDNRTRFYLASLTEIEGFYHRFKAIVNSAKGSLPPATNESSVEKVERMLALTYKARSLPKYNRLYCSWGSYYWTVCPASSTRITSMGVCNTVNVRELFNRTNEAERMDENGGNAEDMPDVGNAMRGLTFYLDNKIFDMDYRLYQYQGFKLVLHEPDEEPLPQSGGIMIPGDTAVEIEVSKQVKIGLPRPFKAFGNSECIDTEDQSFKSPLSRFENYTKEVCEQECFINFVIDFCGGCRHFLFPGNESICPLEHLTVCYREAQKEYYGQKDKTCDCPMPCRQVTYKATVTTMPFAETAFLKGIKAKSPFKQTLSYVHIYYSDPVVTTMKQVAIYSTEGLLGNIGGQIGLFMGFSLVTVAEMLELLFLLATRGRKLDEHVKRHKDAEAAAQAAVQANNKV